MSAATVLRVLSVNTQPLKEIELALMHVFGSRKLKKAMFLAYFGLFVLEFGRDC